MPSTRKVRVYRFIEKTALAVFVVWSGGLAVLFALDRIAGHELLAGIGVDIFILLLILVIQQTIDSWLVMSFSQSDLTQKDVFESLYERSPVGYLTLDTKGRVVNVNPSAVNLLQGSMDSFAGVNFYNFIKDEGEVDLEVLERKVEAGLTVNDMEVPMETIAGNYIWVMVSVSPYRNSGERLVSLIDITEKKNIDTAKSEFVALATHQLRTPIAAIRWNVELLERSLKTIKTESQTRYLAKIERNVLRMINLINDFLSVSKLEMGTYAAEAVSLDLSEFFESVVDKFVEKINEKQIALDRHEVPAHAVINTDSRLIHIIVSNLMSNAVKYSKTNGQLTFSYQLSGSSLQIVVADDGIGIPEGELDKLFTKFYRASNAQSHQTEGTGLGLYIVKQSVEQLGGGITVQSGEDKGARFVVTLPVSVVSA